MRSVTTSVRSTVPRDDSEIERALVIAAHPDDADFGSAGTVATWTAKGIAVSYCIVTSGQAGGFDPTVPRSHRYTLICVGDQCHLLDE